MGDVDPTGDRTWLDDAEQLRADLARERFARRAIDQALLDAITERDSLRAALAEAMAAGQSMEGQCNDLEAERDRLRAVVDALRPIAETVVAAGNPNDLPYAEGNLAAWRFVLWQLDVRKVMGGLSRRLPRPRGGRSPARTRPPCAPPGP